MARAATRRAAARKNRGRKTSGGGPSVGARSCASSRIVALFVVLFVAGVVAGIVASYSRNLPDINRMADYQPSRSTRVFARDGTLLANLYSENRIWVPIDKIPMLVRNAFIATEDAISTSITASTSSASCAPRSPIGVTSSSKARRRSRSSSRAGSFSPIKCRSRAKIQEALLAIEIERYYTKDEILERYLNIIYFGSGAYGIEAAAHTYFGTDVAASDDRPSGDARRHCPPRRRIIRRTSTSQHAKERQRTCSTAWSPAASSRSAQSDARTRAAARPHRRTPDGLAVVSISVFHDVRDASARSAVRHASDVRGRPASLHDARSARCRSGARSRRLGHRARRKPRASARIKARSSRSGRRPARFSRWSAAPAASRSRINSIAPGKRAASRARRSKCTCTRRRSTAACRRRTIVDDSPISYPMGDGTRWAPMDDDHAFLGPITLRYALAQSRNVVAVKLAQQLGIDRVIEYAKRMGVKSPLEANLSLALGTSGVSPLDQAAGYATLANAGIHIDPTPIRIVRDSLGTPVLDNSYPQQTEVVSGGNGLRDDVDVGRRDQRRHGLSERRDRPACRRARPARRRIFATRGSSASRPISSRPSGSATTTTRA